MYLKVSFRNLRARTELRRRAQALFRKQHRFLDPAAEGHLTITVERRRALCELVVTTRGRTYKSLDDAEELRTSLDRVFHKMETQLRRAKGRRTDRHRGRDEQTDEIELLEEDVVVDVEVEEEGEFPEDEMPALQ